VKQIRLGIIGCGEVAEVNSGPAFHRERNSQLIASLEAGSKTADAFTSRSLRVPD
jgi:predicted dehydrogenase